MKFGPICGMAQVLLKAVSIEFWGLRKQIALAVSVAVIFPFSFCDVEAVARDAKHAKPPKRKTAGAQSALSM